MSASAATLSSARLSQPKLKPAPRPRSSSPKRSEARSSPAPRPRPQLTKALDHYTREISSKKKLGNREVDTIRWWQDSPLGPRSLASVRGKDIAAVLATKKSEGAAPHTIHLYLILLSHLFTVTRKRRGHEGLKQSRRAGPRASPAPWPRPTFGRQRATPPPGSRRGLRWGDWGSHHAGHRDRDTLWGDRCDARGACRSQSVRTPDSRNQDRDTPRVPLSTVAQAVLDRLPRRLNGRVWGMPLGVDVTGL